MRQTAKEAEDDRISAQTAGDAGHDCDHIGAVFFPEIPLLRWIGRLAMPVLCFFIGEGLRHTRSPRRYLLRLTGFALLSELPFDLAFYGGIEWGHQNVYFTLALGLLALWAIQSRGMEVGSWH